MSAPVIHHFEAKLYALRKSKDGTIVSWVVHPHDDVAELINLRIGSVVNIAWTLEDDKPVEVEPIEVKGPLTRTKVAGDSIKAVRAARPVISQVAGSSPAPAPTKHERTLAERCAILCQDKRFRDYLSQTYGADLIDSKRADIFIKNKLRIESKSELNEDAPNFNAEAAANFKLLAMTFQSHLLSEKYADVR